MNHIKNLEQMFFNFNLQNPNDIFLKIVNKKHFNNVSNRNTQAKSNTSTISKTAILNPIKHISSDTNQTGKKVADKILTINNQINQNIVIMDSSNKNIINNDSVTKDPTNNFLTDKNKLNIDSFNNCLTDTNQTDKNLSNNCSINNNQTISNTKKFDTINKCQLLFTNFIDSEKTYSDMVSLNQDSCSLSIVKQNQSVPLSTPVRASTLNINKANIHSYKKNILLDDSNILKYKNEQSSLFLANPMLYNLLNTDIAKPTHILNSKITNKINNECTNKIQKKEKKTFELRLKQKLFYKNNLKRNKIQLFKKTNEIPITCYKFKQSHLNSKHDNEFHNNNLSMVEKYSKKAVDDLINKNIVNSKEPYFLEKLFNELKRNMEVIERFNSFPSANSSQATKTNNNYDTLNDKIQEMKKIITIKKCFFVFRNLTPIVYSCIKCLPGVCDHDFDHIILPFNRILLKDITTFLEIMDYPFTSERHHKETKDFLKDELKITEYTNKYCSNIWLSKFFFNNFFYTKEFKEKNFNEKKFIEKDFFEKYNLSLYIESRFGIAIEE